LLLEQPYIEAEPLSVALLSDELRLGVIGLSDDELAGSLRNTSRREACT